MSVNGASLVEESQLKSACGAQLALEFSSALMHGEDFAEVTLKKQLGASRATVWSGAKANAVNNVMIERTTATRSYGGLCPPSPLPSQASEAHPCQRSREQCTGKWSWRLLL